MKRKRYHYLTNYKDREEVVICLRFLGVPPSMILPLSTALLPVSAQQSPQWKTYRGTFTGTPVMLLGAEGSRGVK